LDFQRDIALNPDWEIYWQQFLTPEEFQSGKGLLSGVVNQEVFKKSEGILHQGTVQKMGYVTLRTRIFLPVNPKPMMLFHNRLGGSVRVWMDGKLLTEVGRVGTDRSSTTALLGPTQVEFQARPEGNEIVLQMANFESSTFGPHRPFFVTQKKSFISRQRTRLILDYFLIGSAVVMSFYHFALFMIRRSEPAPRHFGFFCLIVAFRSLLMSEGFILGWQENFGDFPLAISSKIEMFGFTLGVISFLLFLTSLYRKEIPKFLPFTLISLSSLYAAIVLFTDHSFYVHFLQPYQLAVVSGGLIVIYSLMLAVRRRRDGARIFVFGFLLMFTTVINDILYGHKIVNTFDMMPLGLFGFILAQSIILSKRFAKAFEQVSIAEKEIRTLNDDLELKVIERTQTIRTILDNVRSGFLMIDSEFNIMEGFTKSCLEILGPQVAANVSLLDLLDLSNRERILLELALKQVFDDAMPEDVSLAQIPNRYHLGRKVVSVQGSVVRNSLGKPETLLLSIADASQLVKAELESSKNKALLKIISERSSFRAFIKDSLESLNACLTFVELQNQREIAMVLHTLKGNFALYGLEPIAAFIHEIEEKKNVTKLDIRAIVQTVEEFIQLNGMVLGLEFKSLDQASYEIPSETLHKLEVDLQKANISRAALQVMHGWVRDVRMVQVRELLGPIEANVLRVANALGKHVRFEMTGADLRVDPERMRHPLKNLVHALINSIDHGIEYPEERGGKEATGKVSLSFSYDELAYLKVIVEDDGRGLDLKLICQHALEKGLVTESELQMMAESDIQALIFRQGFSTKIDVSEFSGRGVGIAALESAVRSLGGHIRIQSKTDQGTLIDISIPTEQTLDLLTGTA